MHSTETSTGPADTASTVPATTSPGNAVTSPDGVVTLRLPPGIGYVTEFTDPWLSSDPNSEIPAGTPTHGYHFADGTLHHELHRVDVSVVDARAYVRPNTVALGYEGTVDINGTTATLVHLQGENGEAVVWLGPDGRGVALSVVNLDTQTLLEAARSLVLQPPHPTTTEAAG